MNNIKFVANVMNNPDTDTIMCNVEGDKWVSLCV